MNQLWERYQRQIIFPPFGEEGQRKLLSKKVLLAGCGALGSGIAISLVRTGIKELIIVDGDRLELSNLHRQFLYDEDDLKKEQAKSMIAGEKLSRMNSQVKITPVPERLSAQNIEKLASGVDLIMDGTDNLETRYLLNDYAVKHQIPYIFGGVVGASGMLMSIFPKKTACLRCLFPHPQQSLKTPGTAQLGVLNPAPLLLSALEVIEAIKIFLGVKEPDSVLLQFDLWELNFTQQKIKRNPDCLCCQKEVFEFLSEKNED